MDNFPEYGDDYNPEFEEEVRPRDYKIDEAKKTVISYIRMKKEDVFYLRQLEIIFEKEYFHWITAKAVNELIQEGHLLSQLVPIEAWGHAKFVYHKSNRYHQREINRSRKLIVAYSQPSFTSAIGAMAELLFLNAFSLNKFIPLGKNIREHNGVKWEETEHDLDFAIERDGVTYGVEVKNKLDYIEPEELGIKLKMCEHLKLRPLFIMRYAPKSYIHSINNYGGYGMIFKHQIYPLGHEPFADEVVKTLGLPVMCSNAIPQGIIDKFINKFHLKIVNSK